MYKQQQELQIEDGDFPNVTTNHRRQTSNLSNSSSYNPAQQYNNTIFNPNYNSFEMKAWRDSINGQIKARKTLLRAAKVDTKEIRGWRKATELIRKPYEFDKYNFGDDVVASAGDNNKIHRPTHPKDTISVMMSESGRGVVHVNNRVLGLSVETRNREKTDVEEASNNSISSKNNMHASMQPLKNLSQSPWQRHFQTDEVIHTCEEHEIESGVCHVDDVINETRKLQYDIFGVYFNKKRKDLEIRKEPSIIKWWLTLVDGTMPWVYKYLESDDKSSCQWTSIRFVFSYLQWILRGIGQIFFCNNPVTGLFVLVGLFIQSSRVAVHCLLAVITATTSAKLLGFETSMISSGLFGYNASLLGIGLATLHNSEIHSGYTFGVVFGVIITSILSVLIFVALGNVLLKYDVSPMTLPFDIVLSTALLASVSMNNVHFDAVISPFLPIYQDDPNSLNYDFSIRSLVETVLRGIGQIVFTTDIVAISFILVGLAICSRQIAISAIIGSTLGTAFAIFAGLSANDVHFGLYSYCPSLTFIATMIFYVPSLGSFLLALFGVFFTVVLQAALSVMLQISGLPVNSFPFSFIIISLVLLQGSTKFVIAVPLNSITFPEDHSKRVHLLKDGFNLFLEALHTYEKKYSDRMLLNKDIPERTKRADKLLKRIYNTFDLGNIETTVDKHDRVGKCAVEMFRIMEDSKLKGTITFDQFGQYLSSIGLTDEEGINDAVQALSLMDFDKDGSISKQEWIVFCRSSIEMHKIYNIVSTFFQFVDTSGDGFIDLDEINDALRYLNEPALTFDELKLISRLSASPNEFEIDDMTVFVCISTLKNLIEKYRSLSGV